MQNAHQLIEWLVTQLSTVMAATCNDTEQVVKVVVVNDRMVGKVVNKGPSFTKVGISAKKNSGTTTVSSCHSITQVGSV